MPEAIIITPVKDSLNTTKLTIKAISKSSGNFEHYVFNDFSQPETKSYLEKAKDEFNFHLINLEDITTNPSPNYKLVLQKAQKIAIEKNCPLIIIESDVIIKSDTVQQLIQISNNKPDCGIAGAITVDKDGNYNFPYTFEHIKNNEIINTPHSLSFCCTLITHSLLQQFDFKNLSEKKDCLMYLLVVNQKNLDSQIILLKELKYYICPIPADLGRI